MASHSREEQSKKIPGAGKPKQGGELNSGDLDKVTGGIKTGVAAPKPPSNTHSSGDPCMGGE